LSVAVAGAIAGRNSTFREKHTCAVNVTNCRSGPSEVVGYAKHVSVPQSFRLLSIVSVAVCSLLQAQEVRVTGDVKEELTLTVELLAKMPRASAKTSFNGMETVYEGVPLHEVLKRAGVPHGEALRGKALATYVIAEAPDGYQVVFSLGELDQSVVDHEVLLADTGNGKPLFGADGRFRLVIPKDKIGGRSIRMLSKISVVRLRK
jgi:DMSO/TMAO reductase YedYZ molybdopterin-dependent catalytic subunit